MPFNLDFSFGKLSVAVLGTKRYSGSIVYSKMKRFRFIGTERRTINRKFKKIKNFIKTSLKKGDIIRSKDNHFLFKACMF